MKDLVLISKDIPHEDFEDMIYHAVSVQYLVEMNAMIRGRRDISEGLKVQYMGMIQNKIARIQRGDYKNYTIPRQLGLNYDDETKNRLPNSDRRDSRFSRP